MLFEPADAAAGGGISAQWVRKAKAKIRCAKESVATFACQYIRPYQACFSVTDDLF